KLAENPQDHQIRFDLALADPVRRWIREVIARHTGGRLKIAPEHLCDSVLKRMGKAPAETYTRFVEVFDRQCEEDGLRHERIEYFISGFPGCRDEDMIELALALRRARVQPEQVQDFYPAPLTPAAAMFYTGLDWETGEAIFVARSDRQKARQRALLLSHLPGYQDLAREALLEAGREDLIGVGPGALVHPRTGDRRSPHTAKRKAYSRGKNQRPG
ncbi:MAG: DUF3362 domain-containing protein, partial [Planctomycetes bacterium]|nr:DUF3362 domain-containing protein [Planctomycetota bacterium]